MDGITIFEQVRRAIVGTMRLFSEAQMFVIPDGFDNNIAWNLGHIAYLQESITYRLAGATTLTNETHRALFDMGTSPADWQTRPDIGEIKTLLKETGMKLRSDYEDNVFANFEPHTTKTGFHVATIDEAISFVNFHEGLHLGTILSIRNFLER